MTADPLRLLLDDRSQAASLQDPLCDRCFLATVNDHGNPEVRTLVIRDIEGRMGVFVNGSSPKCQQLENSATATVMMYFESIGVQYRVETELSPIESMLVHDMWQNRPDVSKKLDYLYTTFPQSSPMENRELLLASLEEMAVPRVAPKTAKGFYFEPMTSVERLSLDQSDGLHVRTLFKYLGSSWSVQQLVP
ncbi:MAG: pyridoxamine 5'-phosphate oxidase family protein [Gammaproteobacteria bacterium]|nr:pyridoxamine 5'-phosphate oxidase family protein [Gammaproteobacteria bacterium]